MRLWKFPKIPLEIPHRSQLPRHLDAGTWLLYPGLCLLPTLKGKRPSFLMTLWIPEILGPGNANLFMEQHRAMSLEGSPSKKRKHDCGSEKAQISGLRFLGRQTQPMMSQLFEPQRLGSVHLEPRQRAPGCA